jgi:hypothetical protein
MTHIRCHCRECLAGDALPERLQGIPGAFQTTFIAPMPAPERREAMSRPTLDDPKIRDACSERCATFGDPPCWEIGVLDPKPCDECLRDCGIEPGDEFDENAAIRRLL